MLTQHDILLNVLFFVNAWKSNHGPLRVRIILYTLVARFNKLLPNVLGGASDCIHSFSLFFFLLDVTVRLPVRCQVVLREIDFGNCVHHKGGVLAGSQTDVRLFHLYFVQKR